MTFDPTEHINPAYCHDMPLFSSYRATLADITAAGWRVEVSSSGNWWWRHADGRLHYPPVWVEEMIRRAEKQGENNARAEIREAIGGPLPRKRKKPKVTEAWIARVAEQLRSVGCCEQFVEDAVNELRQGAEVNVVIPGGQPLKFDPNNPQ